MVLGSLVALIAANSADMFFPSGEVDPLVLLYLSAFWGIAAGLVSTVTYVVLRIAGKRETANALATGMFLALGIGAILSFVVCTSRYS